MISKKILIGECKDKTHDWYPYDGESKEKKKNEKSGRNEDDTMIYDSR